MRKLTIRLTDEDHKRLRLLSVTLDTSVQVIVAGLIREYLQRHAGRVEGLARRRRGTK